MSTVVNNPAPVTDSGSNGFLIGIILLIGFVLVLLYFGIPAIKNMPSSQSNNQAPQVVIPDKIDVNVKPSQ